MRFSSPIVAAIVILLQIFGCPTLAYYVTVDETRFHLVKSYLCRYGYMNDNVCKQHADDSLKFMQNNARDIYRGLIIFQTMFNITRTGKIDEETLMKMAKPRCGNKDFDMQFTSSKFMSYRTKDYSLLRRGLSQLTYSMRKYSVQLNRYSRSIANDQVERLVERAFDAWLRHLHGDVSVRRLDDYEQLTRGHSNITIYFAEGDHGDSTLFDGIDGELAHSCSLSNVQSAFRGHLHVDDAEDWSADNRRLLAVLIHQIGHLFGLDHSSNPQSVMSPLFHFSDSPTGHKHAHAARALSSADAGDNGSDSSNSNSNSNSDSDEAADDDEDGDSHPQMLAEDIRNMRLILGLELKEHKSEQKAFLTNNSTSAAAATAAAAVVAATSLTTDRSTATNAATTRNTTMTSPISSVTTKLSTTSSTISPTTTPSRTTAKATTATTAPTLPTTKRSTTTTTTSTRTTMKAASHKNNLVVSTQSAVVLEAEEPSGQSVEDEQHSADQETNNDINDDDYEQNNENENNAAAVADRTPEIATTTTTTTTTTMTTTEQVVTRGDEDETEVDYDVKDLEALLLAKNEKDEELENVENEEKSDETESPTLESSSDASEEMVGSAFSSSSQEATALASSVADHNDDDEEVQEQSDRAASVQPINWQHSLGDMSVISGPMRLETKNRTAVNQTTALKETVTAAVTKAAAKTTATAIGEPTSIATTPPLEATEEKEFDELIKLIGTTAGLIREDESDLVASSTTTPVQVSTKEIENNQVPASTAALNATTTHNEQQIDDELFDLLFGAEAQSAAVDGSESSTTAALHDDDAVALSNQLEAALLQAALRSTTMRKTITTTTTATTLQVASTKKKDTTASTTSSTKSASSTSTSRQVSSIGSSNSNSTSNSSISLAEKLSSSSRKGLTSTRNNKLTSKMLILTPNALKQEASLSRSSSTTVRTTSASSTVSTSVNITTTSQPQPADLCTDPLIDAITRTEWGNAFIFKGDFVWHVRGLTKWRLFDYEGWPKRISSIFPGLPGDIDSAYLHDDLFHFTKNDQLWKYKIGSNYPPHYVSIKGYPKQLKDEYPDMPFDGVDSAFSIASTIFFFRDHQFWQSDWNTNVTGRIPFRTNAAVSWRNPRLDTSLTEPLAYIVSNASMYKFNYWSIPISHEALDVRYFLFDCVEANYRPHSELFLGPSFRQAFIADDVYGISRHGTGSSRLGSIGSRHVGSGHVGSGHVGSGHVGSRHANSNSSRSSRLSKVVARHVPAFLARLVGNGEINVDEQQQHNTNIEASENRIKSATTNGAITSSRDTSPTIEPQTELQSETEAGEAVATVMARRRSLSSTFMQDEESSNRLDKQLMFLNAVKSAAFLVFVPTPLYFCLVTVVLHFTVVFTFSFSQLF